MDNQSSPPGNVGRYPIEVHGGMTQNPYATPSSVDATNRLYSWRSFGRASLFFIGVVAGIHIVEIARSGFLRTARHWLDNPIGGLVLFTAIGLLSSLAFAGYRALRFSASSCPMPRSRMSLPLGVAFAVIMHLTLSGMTKLIGHEVRGNNVFIELAMYIVSLVLAAIVTVELQRLILRSATKETDPDNSHTNG